MKIHISTKKNDIKSGQCHLARKSTRPVRRRRRHNLLRLTPVSRKISRFLTPARKITMNQRYPFRWQSFRCGGRRFIYSGGGRGAFQKLLDSPVAPVHPHRAYLVPDSRNRRLPIDRSCRSGGKCCSTIANPPRRCESSSPLRVETLSGFRNRLENKHVTYWYRRDYIESDRFSIGIVGLKFFVSQDWKVSQFIDKFIADLGDVQNAAINHYILRD